METNQALVTDQNKALYRRFITEVFNQGRVENLDELVSQSYVYRDAPAGMPGGFDGIQQIVANFRAAFPDLDISIDDQVAEGNTVCSLITTKGTHKGDFFGIPATGRPIEMRGLTMVRIENGRLCESRIMNDVISFMTQLCSNTHQGCDSPQQTTRELLA